MSTKKGLGCFMYPSIVIIAVISSSVLQLFIPISGFYSFSCLLLFISWALGKITTDSSSYRYLAYSLTLVSVIYIISKGWLSSIHFSEGEKDIPTSIYKEKIEEQGDSIVVLSQDRKWVDNYGNDYQSSFSIREDDYFDSKKAYFRYTQNHQRLEWGTLYRHLSITDAPRLDLIIEKLRIIKQQHDLNQLEFAEMVVTFIQDIPYALVFEERCLSSDRYVDSIRVILEECSDCCIGNIPYGVQTPVGFMGNLKGDCDTRTVIIYTILDAFGYDVAILISDYYKHSILGLHIPASGHYKTHSGKRYYTWETTNKHYTIGKLPRNLDNMNYWNIVLTNT